VLAVATAVAASLVARFDPVPGTVVDTPLSLVAARALSVLAVVLAGYGLYVLVSTNQPSGRIITLPNSVVLSSDVFNHSSEEFPYVRNELAIQVAYETDLPFTRRLMIDVADDYLGDEMAARIATYRERFAETGVELEVGDRPTINVQQRESWVELRLRYLTHPRRGTRVRNELYERVLVGLNEHPERVSFPVSRNR
jgi:small-conductance mechanosensitive channel